MPRPKGVRDVAPEIRGALIRALAIMEDKGKPLSTLIVDAIEEQGILKVLDTLSKYNPKTVDANVNGTISLEDFVTGAMAHRGITIDHEPAKSSH